MIFGPFLRRRARIGGGRPQATFDPEKGEYLIYWSHHNAQGGDPNTVIWYAYSRDLKTLSTPPAELFRPANGQDGIDGDIVEKDGVFYLYYKDEAKKCIRYAVADCLTGPYREPEENEVSLSRKHVEGNFIYRIVGTDTFVMMMDEYTNGRFFYSRQKIWSILKSCAAEITAWISSRAMVQCSLLGREHIKRF